MMLRFVLALLALTSVASFAPRLAPFPKQQTVLPAFLGEENGMNLYEVLGASPTSSPKELKKRYHTLARQLHPDANLKPKLPKQDLPFFATRNNNGLDAEDPLEFSQVAAAWTTLSDPQQRLRYDRSLIAKEIADNVEGLFVACLTVAFNTAQFVAHQLKVEQRKQESKMAAPKPVRLGWTQKLSSPLFYIREM